MKKAKTQPQVSAERVMMEMTSRYSLIRNLTPERLSSALDAFAMGHLREFALLADKIAERDDKLPNLISKRVKAASRRDWEIVCDDDDQDAVRQKEVLEDFYSNLRATSAVDEDERGGLNLLIRYMLKAVGMRWSVQEIVWRPTAGGMSAEFRDVPLWYFEHHTSRLRYLPSEGQYDGIPLNPGEWLVTRSEGLMIPCSILYLYKHMPLRDWLIYSQRYVVPGLHGKTDATKGSDEWNDLVAALKAFNLDWALVSNKTAEISPIDVSAKGELPYPKLVDWCDRAMAILYRGGDLSTMSSADGQGTGASLQGAEGDVLVADDLMLVGDTLNAQVSLPVVENVLGDKELKARIRLTSPQRMDVKQELDIDTFLIDRGCAVAKSDLLERYGRSQPDTGEELATPAAVPQQAFPTARPALLNAIAGDRGATIAVLGDTKAGRLQAAARTALARAMAQDLAPIRSRIEQALANRDDAAMLASLRAIPGELPQLLVNICRNPAAQAVIEESLTAALLNGWAEGRASHQGEEQP